MNTDVYWEIGATDMQYFGCLPQSRGCIPSYALNPFFNAQMQGPSKAPEHTPSLV